MDNKETTRLVIKQLDLMTKSVKDTARQFKTTTIPIKMLTKVINIAKIDIDKTESKDFIGFFTQFNLLLDSLLDQCKGNAEDMEVTYIPVVLFESHVGFLKRIMKDAE